MPGTLETDHKWLLDTHVELEHQVEGAMDNDAMWCVFESCTYAARDKWSGTKEELLFVLEKHVRKEHPIPTVELVDELMTRNWWANYRKIYAYYKDVYGIEKDVRNFLCTCIGEAGGLVLEELGVQKFLALTEQQLLEESERIAVQGGAMSIRGGHNTRTFIF